MPVSTDPLAESARSTLRLVRLHLEDDWLPQLTRITGSTAMTGDIDITQRPRPQAHAAQ